MVHINPTPAPALQPGQLILSGKYRVEAFLGQGAFAQVYRVHHLELKADRAVKVVSRDTPGVGSTVLDDFRARFRQEAQLGARLDHPHVIRIYDFEEAEGGLYLVMECAAGSSLAKRLKDKGPLPVAEAVRLTLEAAAGLEVLHGLGAVHRDVKPSNLLLDAGGHLKLADLGLAQLPGGLSQRSLAGSLAPSHPGTPEYMSPEQETTSGFLTASSDVYSLGCVLFELLTGRLWKQAVAEVEDVRELRPEAPESVAVVLGRMLCQQPGQRKSDAADPAKRYVTMGSVRQAMQEAQHVAEQQARWRQLYQHGKDALARHDCMAGIAALQSLLAEAPGYADAVALLADAQVAQHRQRLIEQLTGQARRQQAGDWAGLAETARELQPLSEPAARPFLEVLAAEEQHQRAEATRRERERQAAEAAQRERERQLAATRYISPEPVRRPAQPAARQRSGSGWLWGAGVLAAGLVAIWLMKPQFMQPLPGGIRAAFQAQPTASATPTTWVRAKDGMVMVYVPAGDFLMGSPAGEGHDDEHPQHRVTLDAFWIDRTEVTNAQYEQCVQAGACRASGNTYDPDLVGANQPVAVVDWNQAQAYCQWAGARVLTEAEWEKAARGTDGRRYPWGNQEATCEYAWMDDGSGYGCGQGKPWLVVGSKPTGVSPYGALDMAGSAWEWVADWYAADYYSGSPGRNPPGPVSGQERVMRGGSWGTRLDYVRSAYRDRSDPTTTYNHVGFRCGVSSTPSP